MSASDIAVSRQEDVVLLTLNRPDAANALNTALQERFTLELTAAELDATVGAVVVTGAGRIFSAGADLKNPSSWPLRELAERRAAVVQHMILALLDFTKPIVAAVNGPAIGAGCMIALLCDGVVASDTAFFSLPEIDAGIPSPLGYTVIEMLLNGTMARDLVLSGRRMPAAEAQAFGLVELSRPDEAAERAHSKARFLAGKQKAAFALNKEWVNGDRKRKVRSALVASHQFRARN